MALMAVYAINMGEWTPDKGDLGIRIYKDELCLSCIVGYEIVSKETRDHPADIEPILYEESVKITQEMDEGFIYEFIQEFLQESYLQTKKTKNND